MLGSIKFQLGHYIAAVSLQTFVIVLYTRFPEYYRSEPVPPKLKPSPCCQRISVWLSRSTISVGKHFSCSPHQVATVVLWLFLNRLSSEQSSEVVLLRFCCRLGKTAGVRMIPVHNRLHSAIRKERPRKQKIVVP